MGIALLGMLVVFIFIFIMVGAISLLPRFGFKPKPCLEPQPGEISSHLVSVISAAIHVHTRKKKERRDAP